MIVDGEPVHLHAAGEDVELNQITDLLAKKVDEIQASIVVVDSLSELRLLARDSFRYRRQMLCLKNFFEERNCTVLLLDEAAATASRKSASAVTGRPKERDAMMLSPFGISRSRSPATRKASH